MTKLEPEEVLVLPQTPICQAIADSGFTGFVAHEFIPVRDPIKSLEEAFRLCDV